LIPVLAGKSLSETFFHHFGRGFGIYLCRLDFRMTEKLLNLAGEAITLIHDQSTPMLQQKPFWDAIVDPAVPAQEVGYDVRTYSFPLNVQETRADEDSKTWDGLQIADLLAGAATDSAKWLLDDNRKEEGLAYELNQIINSGSFFIHSLWSSGEQITPEMFETPPPLQYDAGDDSSGGNNSYNLIDELISRVK
jgi:hypothetical protein